MKANVDGSSATFAHGAVPAAIAQNRHSLVCSTWSLTAARLSGRRLLPICLCEHTPHLVKKDVGYPPRAAISRSSLASVSALLVAWRSCHDHDLVRWQQNVRPGPKSTT